jgi:hypothetical protein
MFSPACDAAALGEAKRVAVTLHVLHHDHAIGAGGYRRAGHDFDRLSGLDRKSSLAGANQPNDLKRLAGRKVGGTAGKPVAGGARKRRLIAVGKNRLGQHHAQSIEQGSGLHGGHAISSRHGRHAPDDPAGVRIADHPGWSGVVQVQEMHS